MITTLLEEPDRLTTNNNVNSMTELWKSKSTAAQHLDNRTVYVLSVVHSLIKKEYGDQGFAMALENVSNAINAFSYQILVGCTNRERRLQPDIYADPLFELFSDILCLARDNTEWGAEFQGKSLF